MFSFTLTQDDIFLRLLNIVFNQRKFQYKLLTLSSKCNLEKDLQPILYNIYKKNLEVETQDYRVTRREFLNAMVEFLKTIQFLNYHLSRRNRDGYVFSHRWLIIHNKGFIHIWLNLNRTKK